MITVRSPDIPNARPQIAVIRYQEDGEDSAEPPG
jgi:hypothetical protein